LHNLLLLNLLLHELKVMLLLAQVSQLMSLLLLGAVLLAALQPACSVESAPAVFSGMPQVAYK
jgi:hypothetical protein